MPTVTNLKAVAGTPLQQVCAKYPEVEKPLHGLDDYATRFEMRGAGAHEVSQNLRRIYDDAKAQLAKVLSGPTIDPDQQADAEAAVAEAKRRLDAASGLAQPHLIARTREIEIRDEALRLLQAARRVRVIPAKPLGNDGAACERASAATVAVMKKLAAADHAPLPLPEAIEFITEKIDAASQGIKVGLGADGLPFIRWPFEMLHVVSTNGAVPTVVPADGLAAFVARDVLVASARRQLEQVYTKVDYVLSRDEQAKERHRLQAELLTAERVEAATIWAARAAGHEVPWRHDISVPAVLGVDIIKN